MRRDQVQQRTRNAVILGLSVLGHLAVFAALGMRTPGLMVREIEEPPPVEIILPPPTTPPRLEPRRSAPPADAAAPRLTLAPSPRPRQVSPLAPEARIAPLPMAPAASGAGTGTEAGRAPTIFPDQRGEVTGILRASPVGCNSADLVKLTAREREKCFERAGAMARKGGPVAAPIDADKRARYDRAAAKKQRDREWRERETIPTGTQEEGPDGWPAGIGPPSSTRIPIP